MIPFFGYPHQKYLYQQFQELNMKNVLHNRVSYFLELYAILYSLRVRSLRNPPIFAIFLIHQLRYQRIVYQLMYHILDKIL